MRFIFLVLTLTILFACNTPPETEIDSTPKMETEAVNQPPKPQFVQQLEEGHAMKKFHEADMVAFDIDLTFKGNKALEGRIISSTDSGKIRLDKKDGTSIVFDGENTFVIPDNPEDKGARFSIFTWQYFVLAPFKLSDPGTKWEMLEAMPLFEQKYDSGKLSFTAGTGDAPDDWYIVFRNDTTNLMDGMAYIVTAGGRSQEEAEKNVSAVTYHDYKEVGGIPMPKEMKFWYYDLETGLKDQKGFAFLSNYEFMKMDDSLFVAPEDESKEEM